MRTFESTETHRVMYRCKKCKKVYRRTFEVTHRAVHNEHPEWYLRRTYHYYSIDGKGFGGKTDRLYYPIHICECGSALCGTRIDGRVVDTCPCDRRCTHAKGHSCECSCGGANHGSAYQV